MKLRMSVKVREILKRNGMNPQEKALKSKHPLKPSVTMQQVTTEKRVVKKRELRGKNAKLTNKRAERHMTTQSIALARKKKEQWKNRLEERVKIVINLQL